MGMTIWHPSAPVEQPGLALVNLQPNFTFIKGEQLDINSLLVFIFENNASPTQWRNATITLDEEEEKVNLTARRPVLPPPAWQ